MPLDVTATLDRILTATRDEAAAKASIARYRAALEDEARAEVDRRGTYPVWTAPQLGAVEYRAPGPWAPVVANELDWSTWAAQHIAREDATVTITVRAADAEAAVEALDFASVEYEAGLVTIPPHHLEELKADTSNALAAAPVYYWTDPASGEDVIADGIRANRTIAQLRVSLDPARKREAVKGAEEAANTALLELGEGAPDHEPLRVALEQYKRDVLAGYAVACGMSTGGTKAQLAERLARYAVDADPATLPAGLANDLLGVAGLAEHPEPDFVPTPDELRALAPTGHQLAEGNTTPRHLRAVPSSGDPVVDAAVDLRELEELATEAKAYADGKTLDDLKLEARQLGRPTTGTKVAVARRILLARRPITA